jgi:hypothetical protein
VLSMSCVMTLDTKKCVCGSDMTAEQGGIFACEHCDAPHLSADSCALCAALRARD